ncbi:hypothetical protein GCM10017752_04690 [Streptomyces roseoviridis]
MAHPPVGIMTAAVPPCQSPGDRTAEVRAAGHVGVRAARRALDEPQLGAGRGDIGAPHGGPQRLPFPAGPFPAGPGAAGSVPIGASESPASVARGITAFRATSAAPPRPAPDPAARRSAGAAARAGRARSGRPARRCSNTAETHGCSLDFMSA